MAPGWSYRLHSGASFGGWAGSRAEWPAGSCPMAVSCLATRPDWASEGQGVLSQAPATGWGANFRLMAKGQEKGTLNETQETWASS